MPNKIKQITELFKRMDLIYYIQIKTLYKSKKGRKFSVGLLEQIVLTLFKLRYNLPDRILERLFNIDHVTIHRIINRITVLISETRIILPNDKLDYYVVDSTTVRIGKDKSRKSYSGFKHHHGIKFQLVVDNNSKIRSSSKAHLASIQDKKLFLEEYEAIQDKIDKTLTILGDKAYVGLERFRVSTPKKRNELRYKKDKALAKVENRNLSSKRIKIEHIFAYMKNYRILSHNFYYSIQKIERFFKAIANIYNLSRV